MSIRSRSLITGFLCSCPLCVNSFVVPRATLLLLHTPFVRLVEAVWRTVSNTLATRMPCHFDLAILWICQRFEKRASLLYVARSLVS
jgi:hypothetical protein